MKIGLLPLYVKLYDDKLPEWRIRMDVFYENIAKRFEGKGLEVVRSPFCRLENEFKDTVRNFEEAKVDAIVTIHIAYSPSLESIDALSGTDLPLIVLDTTEALEFMPDQDPGEVAYCHGVHGVMDMCSMLTRRGKAYTIAAGHFDTSDCVDRVCGYVRAAVAAAALKKAKAGLIGGIFAGMGDFRVPYEELKERFGFETIALTADEMKTYAASVTAEEIAAEKAKNAEDFTLDENVIDEEYEASIRACLATRKAIADKGLTAFSVNFSNMGEVAGIDSMPFLEACKAMERGIGYAGEGDTMTAAFVGALLQSYPETNFVEIFCPDWKNNLMFMSHMGELNYRVAALKPHIKRVATNYSPGRYPYVGYTRMKGGKGVYMNVSHTKDDFKIFLSEAEMLDCEKDNFGDSMRGFMKLGTDAANFLEQHSIHGATHHSIFVYGATAKELQYFARLLNVECVTV